MSWVTKKISSLNSGLLVITYEYTLRSGTPELQGRPLAKLHVATSGTQVRDK